jgi:hypothetical protein
VRSKICRDCGDELPLTEFTRNRNSRDGYAFYCKKHARLRHQAGRDGRTGGPTGRVPRDVEVPAVHVDHDHATDAVRALLCVDCNGGLAQFRDDPAVLRAAAEYVERHRERQRADRPRPLARRRPEVTVRTGRPPVGSQRRPPATWRTGLCSRGRALLAAREADT